MYWHIFQGDEDFPSYCLVYMAMGFGYEIKIHTYISKQVLNNFVSLGTIIMTINIGHFIWLLSVGILGCSPAACTTCSSLTFFVVNQYMLNPALAGINASHTSSTI